MIVIPVIVKPWAVSVSERFVLLVVVVDDAENVVAAVRVAVEGEGMRVVGGHDHEGLVEVHVTEDGRDRVVQLGQLGQCQLSVVVVVGMVDAATLHHQDETGRLTAQQTERLYRTQKQIQAVCGLGINEEIEWGYHGVDIFLRNNPSMKKMLISLIGF